VLVSKGWGRDVEEFELLRRQMFDEVRDIPSLHCWVRKLLDAWPESQGSEPFTLVAIDGALNHWPRIREALTTDEAVKQTDLIRALELEDADAKALRHLVWVLSGCGVLQRRTLKNRVHIRFLGEVIDQSALRDHWQSGWAHPGKSFNVVRPMYMDLDPTNHDTIADLLSLDGREVFEKNASQKAIDELNRVEREHKRRVEAEGGNSTRAILKAGSSMYPLLFCLDRSLDKPKRVRQEIPTETIEAPRSGQVGKLAFLDVSGTPCSREDVAMDFYRQRGFRTQRGEVRFWQAMFGVAFWEEIFGGTGTPNEIQDIPVDLFSGDEFYRTRRSQIDRKAKRIAQSEVQSFISEQLRRYGNQWTRIVYDVPQGDFSYRAVLESPEVAEFLRTIPAPVFAKIVLRIATNPSENRAGLPDYMIWKGGEVTFVEVKGPREKIRDSQTAWLAWMQAEGIAVKIVRVSGGA